MSHKDVYSESTGPDSDDFYRLRRQNQKVPLEKQEKKNKISESNSRAMCRQKVNLSQPEKAGRK